MGRTNRTYRDRLESTHSDLGDFRRALRYRDQAHYDRLWEHARGYADAAGYANLPRDLDSIYLSILVAQERRITELEARLNE
ncbi:hypothetical protein [Halobacterium wangiae]|uniref:hypothetical protein n=1 Tax=Halobacterium wangiae TaxID=2902623 RepID=UPI001E37B0F9|nr:hypothetical protein [Halobacterium wangiae]